MGFVKPNNSATFQAGDGLAGGKTALSRMAERRLQMSVFLAQYMKGSLPKCFFNQSSLKQWKLTAAL